MKKAVLKNFAIFTGKLQAYEFITVTRVINLKLAFTNTNQVIQNLIPKLNKALLFLRNQVICLKN